MSAAPRRNAGPFASSVVQRHAAQHSSLLSSRLDFPSLPRSPNCTHRPAIAALIGLSCDALCLLLPPQRLPRPAPPGLPLQGPTGALAGCNSQGKPVGRCSLPWRCQPPALPDAPNLYNRPCRSRRLLLHQLRQPAGWECRWQQWPPQRPRSRRPPPRRPPPTSWLPCGRRWRRQTAAAACRPSSFPLRTPTW
jgi:hypothetical protein